MIILDVQRRHLANWETDYFPMKGVSTKQSVNGWYFKGQDAARRETGAGFLAVDKGESVYLMTQQAMRLMPAIAT